MIAARTAWVEAVEAIRRRPGRSSTTVLVIAVGVLTLVATLGVAANGLRAVQARFDAYESQVVRVEGWSPGNAREEREGLARLREQPAVRAAGVVAPLADTNVPVSTHPLASSMPREVVLATPGALDALSTEVVLGRVWDEAMAARCEPVVVLGEAVAARMGADARWLGRTVWVGGHARTLVGVVRSPAADPAIRSQVVLPYAPGCAPPGLVADRVVLARTARGAAAAVAEVAPAALSPRSPRSLTAQAPQAPANLRALVLGDTQRLLLALAAVALVVAVVVTTMTLMASVNERRAEIGLRRAIGATRGDIIGQMLVESGLLGLAGAAFGLLAGTVVTLHHGLVTGVAGEIAWPWILLALAAGLGSGVLGGAWPAVRASRVDPATALTSS